MGKTLKVLKFFLIILGFFLKNAVQNSKFNTTKDRNITGILLEKCWNRVFGFDNVVFLQKKLI